MSAIVAYGVAGHRKARRLPVETTVAMPAGRMGAAIESSPFEEALIATPRRAVVLERCAGASCRAQTLRRLAAARTIEQRDTIEPEAIEAEPVVGHGRGTCPSTPPSAEIGPGGTAPCSGPVRTFTKAAPAAITAVIPIIRARRPGIDRGRRPR